MQTPQALQPLESAISQTGTLMTNSTQQIAALCSGFGQYHTNNPTTKAQRKPYNLIALADVKAMLSNPARIEKSKAQWVIFSSLANEYGRVAEKQREEGLFHALWADLDHVEGMAAIKVFSQSCGVIGHETWFYTSRSATEQNPKGRLIIPLLTPVTGKQFEVFQEVLNNKLAAAGIAPDPASQTANQVMYLPNRGEFYTHYFTQDGTPRLDPKAWQPEALAIHEARKKEAVEVKQRNEIAKEKLTALQGKQGFLPIEAVNSLYDCENLWQSYGAKRVGSKLLSPFSESGVAGISIVDGGNRWISNHGNDVALGIGKVSNGGGSCSGDAFDLITYFEFNNDHKAAVKEMAQELDAAGDKERKKAFAIAQAAEVKPVDFGSIQVQEIEAVQDEEIRNAGTFAGILANTSLGKYAMQVADAIQMPRDTTVLTALGVVSAAVSMVYKVEYQYGGDLPTSLYVATEQPASSGKSPVLNRFTRPIQVSISALNAESTKFNAELEKDSEIAPKAYYKAFVTDTTPEALDEHIAKQFGHFSLASAEQAVVNTALGVNYSDGKKASNNDLILKGYSGDYHSSLRLSRGGFDGYVTGAVTVIAQRGTIETILERSDGTGIAERFIMLAEPTLLGYRDHLTPRAQPSMELKVSYSNAMESLVKLYGSTRDNGSVKYEDLTKLFLGAADWHKINLEKQALEPTMRDGGKHSHEMLRGVVGKFDQRVMKIAANLHVVETLMAKSGIEVPKQIGSSHVDTAIQLAKLTIDCLFKSMVDKGIIGMSAEEEVVYSVVSKRGSNGILWSELYNSTKGLQPFKSYPSKGLAAKIKAVAVEMEKSGKLSSAESQQGGKTVIKIYVN